MKTRTLLIAVLLLLGNVVFADSPATGAYYAPGTTPGGFVQLADTSQSPLLNQAYQTNGLANFINALFKIAISVGAILAVLQLTYAGFLYMSSEAFGEKSHAKEVIGNAVLGLVLLLSVYLILYQINPDLVSLKFLETISSNS